MEFEEQLFKTNKDLKSALMEAQNLISKLENDNKSLQLNNIALEDRNKDLQVSIDEINSEISLQQIKIDELFEVNNDLDNLISSTSIGTIFLNKELLIRKFSPEAKKQFKLRNDDINKPIGDLTLQLGNTNIVQESQQVIESKISIDREIQNIEGRWFSKRISPFFTPEGTVDGVVLSFIDIDNLKASEHKYQHQNQAFMQVLEGTMAGYFDWLLTTNDEYLSPTFKRMFGYEDHEMENKPESWQKIIHPDDMPIGMAAFEKHIASKGKVPFDCELRYFHKDGSIVWVLCRAKVIEWGENDEPIRVVGSHIDITPLKKYSQELERINHELDQFAYIASHDLQEPLRNVTNYINLMIEEHSDELGIKPKLYMDLIHSSAERMKNLIRGFLKFSRIGRELKFMKVNCREILNEVLDDLTLMTKESGALIKVDSLPVLMGLKVELRQLFYNLIGNAIKFRKPDVPLEIEISSNQIENGWEFSITDNGIGMEKVDSEKLFQIFQRMHINNRYEGEGIGLAICKKVVDLHKGKIWAESTLGQGTTFFFTISNTN